MKKVVPTIDQPMTEYTKKYKDLIKENATKYYENLEVKTGVSETENHRLVSIYKEKEADYNKKQKKANSIKTLRILLIVLSIISCIVGIVLITSAIKNKPLNIIFLSVGIVLIVLALFSVVMIIWKMNAVVNIRVKKALEAKKIMEDALDVCWKQMAPLNSIFDDNMPDEILMQTTPSIEVDRGYDLEKFAYMVNKFNFSASNLNDCSSVLLVKSGQIQGSPFVVLRTLNQEMYNHVYTGSTTYTYTTTSRDSDGNLRTVHHTTTLTAQSTHPASRYFEDEQLIYANPAAPDLTFSRGPTLKNNQNEKQIEKFIEKQAKINRKRTDKAASDNDPNTNYQKMTNDEFESLFNASDRNNEVQFRLMFTPLAQKNLSSLIKESIYGDDFYFSKEHKINRIFAKHSQNFDDSCNPDRYVSFDIDISKKSFIDYVVDYFNNLYFMLAPILSIPIYQQTKPFEYIYDKPYDFNLCPYDHEKFSNCLDQSSLKNSKAKTLGINKTSYVKTVGNFDIVDVTNNAFDMLNRVDYIPVTAPDGAVVNVPVPWYEYVPVSKTTQVAFFKGEGTTKEVQETISNQLNSSDISFANKDTIFYNNSVVGFVLNKIIDKSTSYPQVDNFFKEFSSRYLEGRNANNQPNNNQVTTNNNQTNTNNNQEVTDKGTNNQEINNQATKDSNSK